MSVFQSFFVNLSAFITDTESFFIDIETPVHLKPWGMETNAPTSNDEKVMIPNIAQSILAEKRTHLAMLRTGIAIPAVPMTFVCFLIVTFRFYHATDVMLFLITLFIRCSRLFQGKEGVNVRIRYRVLFPDTGSSCFLLP